MLTVDEAVVRWLNHLADHPVLRAGAVAGAKYLIVVPVAVVVVLGGAALRRRDTHALTILGLTAVGSAAALALNQVVGHLYFRLRPYWALASVHALVSRSGDSSFYSDHTTVVAGLAFGVWFINRRWAAVATVAALVVAGARVAVGAHYPSDVVAGAVIGVGCVAAVLLVRQPTQRLLDRVLRPDTVASAPKRHERRVGMMALILLAGLGGWMVARLQDHGLRSALTRAEGRLQNQIPSDARLYREVSIDDLAAGHVRSSRARITGRVTYVNRELDGDVHIELRAPDHAFVVLEIIPELPLPAPSDDDQITAWGVVRHDGLHNWWELHPLIGWTYGHPDLPSTPGEGD